MQSRAGYRPQLNDRAYACERPIVAVSSGIHAFPGSRSMCGRTLSAPVRSGMAVRQLPALRIRICSGSLRRRKGLLRDFRSDAAGRLKTSGLSDKAPMLRSRVGLPLSERFTVSGLANLDLSQFSPPPKESFTGFPVGCGRAAQNILTGRQGPYAPELCRLPLSERCTVSDPANPDL